jgi:hypothetical protein
MVEISKELFNTLAMNPKKISLDQSISLKKLVKKYPFFQTARVIELIGLKKFKNIRFKKALKKTAIQSSNRPTLYEIIELDNITTSEENKIFSLDNSKNSFLNWLKVSNKSDILKNNQDSIIENFLNSDHRIISNNENYNKDFSENFSPEKKEYMTETLAKTYFDQKKYHEAIKAYEVLSLKYPEKISLFADQIKTIKNKI